MLAVIYLQLADFGFGVIELSQQRLVLFLAGNQVAFSSTVNVCVPIGVQHKILNNLEANTRTHQ